MGFFSRLFARKKGGTVAGNLLRMTPPAIAFRSARNLYDSIRNRN